MRTTRVVRWSRSPHDGAAGPSCRALPSGAVSRRPSPWRAGWASRWVATPRSRSAILTSRATLVFSPNCLTRQAASYAISARACARDRRLDGRARRRAAAPLLVGVDLIARFQLVLWRRRPMDPFSGTAAADLPRGEAPADRAGARSQPAAKAGL